MFLTIRKAARTLDVPERLIRSMVAQGISPRIYSGNRFLVNTDLLRDYLLEESLKVKEKCVCD